MENCEKLRKHAPIPPCFLVDHLKTIKDQSNFPGKSKEKKHNITARTLSIYSFHLCLLFMTLKGWIELYPPKKSLPSGRLN